MADHPQTLVDFVATLTPDQKAQFEAVLTEDVTLSRAFRKDLVGVLKRAKGPDEDRHSGQTFANILKSRFLYGTQPGSSELRDFFDAVKQGNLPAEMPRGLLLFLATHFDSHKLELALRFSPTPNLPNPWTTDSHEKWLNLWEECKKHDESLGKKSE